MRTFVVFYAWQTDRLQRLNRHLIRIALNLAAKDISDDPSTGVQVRIESDTENELGHVPVTDTILRKIAACDAFVPDLTFVAKTEAGKLVPNPNVMLEYGYALRAKSHSVMIPVMNTAYGPPEQLPFDMGHLRHPLQYHLPVTAKNAERRAVRKALKEDIERILRLMIDAAPTRPGTAFQEAQSTESPAFFFPHGAAIANFGFPGEQAYRFEGDKVIYVRVFPKYSDDQPKPGRAQLKTLIHDRRIPNPMAPTIGGIASSNNYGWIIIDPTYGTQTQGITQGFPTGELWGINSQVFVAGSINRGLKTEPATAMPMITVEKLYTRTLENYISASTSQFRLRPPFVVELGAVGLKDVFMAAPHPEVPSGSYYGPFREDSLVRRYDLQSAKDAEVLDILRQFFNELYDLAECSRADVLTDEHVTRNNIPPRA
jgi:hypothetical protein